MNRFSSASRARRDPAHAEQCDRGLAQQIDLLKVQGTRWRAEVAHWMAEATEERRGWRKELDSLREELKQAAQQRRLATKAREECRSLQTQLSGLESRCTLEKEATQQEVRALHDDLRYVKVRIARLHDSRDGPVDRLSYNVKRIEERCEHASKSLDTLRDDLETLREDMVELTGDVRRLETLDTSPCMLAEEANVSQEDSDMELWRRELAARRAREDLAESSLEGVSDESNVELWRRELAAARAEERTEAEEWHGALTSLREDVQRLRSDLEAEMGTWKEEQLQFQDNVEDFVVRRMEGSCRQLSEDLEILREQLQVAVDEHQGDRKAMISRLYATAEGLDPAGVEKAVQASRVSARAMCRIEAMCSQNKPTLAVAAAAAVEEELLGLHWEVRQLRLLQSTLPVDAVFDLSGVDFSQFERGDNWTSELFPLGGVQGFRLRVYPYGEMRSPKGKCSLFLSNRASPFKSFHASFRLEVNDLSSIHKTPNWEVGWWGSYDFFPVASEENPLRRVRVELLSYARSEDA